MVADVTGDESFTPGPSFEYEVGEFISSAFDSQAKLRVLKPSDISDFIATSVGRLFADILYRHLTAEVEQYGKEEK